MRQKTTEGSTDLPFLLPQPLFTAGGGGSGSSRHGYDLYSPRDHDTPGPGRGSKSAGKGSKKKGLAARGGAGDQTPGRNRRKQPRSAVRQQQPQQVREEGVPLQTHALCVVQHSACLCKLLLLCVYKCLVCCPAFRPANPRTILCNSIHLQARLKPAHLAVRPADELCRVMLCHAVQPSMMYEPPAARSDSALRHMLSGGLRRWVLYEWLYPAIDRPWFMKNELQVGGCQHVVCIASKQSKQAQRSKGCCNPSCVWAG